MTAEMLGIGDDGKLHWWRWTMGEEMQRLCDNVIAVNVTEQRTYPWDIERDTLLVHPEHRARVTAGPDWMGRQ